MFKSFNYNNLNTPLTYIVTGAAIPAVFLVKRVSLKLSIITGLGVYLYNVLTKPAAKKACCGGKNKVNGKCCSGNKDCGPKKVVKKKACCGGKGNCSKTETVGGDNGNFDDLATDMTAKFAKK